ncbi:CG0192-related protein [Homoserinimonas sp. A520]
MALLYQAELRPTKLELVGGWAPSQPWFAGHASDGMASVASYRFDDPAGEVGVETLLVKAGDGPVMQLPLTYRGVPLVDADEWLIGTLEHSVLGTRWVYDGVGDPVYFLTAASVIITGGGQAELYVDINGQQMHRDPTAKVSGSGMEGVSLPALPIVDELSVGSDGGMSVVESGGLTLAVRRVLDGDYERGGESRDAATGVLSGTWTDQPEPQVLVVASGRQTPAQ